ncbi:MAG: neutral/alkaline non-lysosomal ceramidase N-terminal domain-containing protein [Sedimentisphaerales bacterium]|nr:neutral/alkaline non-lysosomal ceramidase N-terminal domain-containing protein [Sedimentisphaerales bacterium]
MGMTKKHRLFCLSIFLCTLMTLARNFTTPAYAQEIFQAGIATTAITPQKPMWMSGYAARNKPSEGKVHDLRAKALVLQDNQQSHLIIVTVDLLGISRPLRDRLQDKVSRLYKIPPEFLMLNASHTHSGPVVKERKDSIYGDDFYGLSPEQIERSKQYVELLEQKILELIGNAIENLAPARLSYTHARAGFAMNRRLKTKNGYTISPNPDGPVDHDVPVLCIESHDGKLRAVLFGYACHNTTLSFYEFCGDYAGFAQYYIEEAHPDVTAMFIAGCGGDQNPYPRRTLDLAQQHGRALANGVETALISPKSPVRGPISAALDTVILDFAEPPGRRQLEQKLKSDNKYEHRHAKVLLNELEQTGSIRKTYPYLVQVIQFGNDLTMVALSGEVVIDYSLRLKKELSGSHIWVAGYSNDVFGYLPSLRVLNEGGYEGGDAMLYTPFPGPFAPSVENRVIEKVHSLVRKARTPVSN